MGRLMRVAILGGDGRRAHRHAGEAAVRSYPSHRNGGRRALRRFEASVRSGGVDQVVVHPGFIGHDVFFRVRRLCQQHKIPLHYWSEWLKQSGIAGRTTSCSATPKNPTNWVVPLHPAAELRPAHLT